MISDVIHLEDVIRTMSDSKQYNVLRIEVSRLTIIVFATVRPTICCAEPSLLFWRLASSFSASFVFKCILFLSYLWVVMGAVSFAALALHIKVDFGM